MYAMDNRTVNQSAPTLLQCKRRHYGFRCESVCKIIEWDKQVRGLAGDLISVGANTRKFTITSTYVILNL